MMQKEELLKHFLVKKNFILNKSYNSNFIQNRMKATTAKMVPFINEGFQSSKQRLAKDMAKILFNL